MEVHGGPIGCVPFRIPVRASRSRSDWSPTDRKSTRLNSSHGYISYAVFCLKKKKNKTLPDITSDLISREYPQGNPFYQQTSILALGYPHRGETPLQTRPEIAAHETVTRSAL